VAAKRILVTGGAGFVGSHTVDALIRSGHDVVVYDNIIEQVHSNGFPSYMSTEAEFMQGDVCDLHRLTRAVRGADIIFHLAAAVGVGQSMYQIADYIAVNTGGTANLLQAILDSHSQPEKIVVASSMSIYGEGEYICVNCGVMAPLVRNQEQLQRKQWEVACSQCGHTLLPSPTREQKPLHCSSIYALSKKDQEEMCLLFGRTYQLPVVALRYFNIFGVRQALSNPYTGVVAIFASRLLNAKSPLVFEDGSQLRDFVSVEDIVRANLLAMNSSDANGLAINIGSGQPVSIREIAAGLASLLDIEVPVEVTGKYRAGDIRHCYADISTASRVLGYKPTVCSADGLARLVEWLKEQPAEDHVADAMQRLEVRGLVA
jgi:dTDP-L-rhamnose 4-epimerase